MPMQNSLLIVDADEELRDLLSRRFIQLGFDVTPVGHSRQALSAATFKPFHVAIVDQTLCEIDGMCLMQKLKRLVAGIQVVILSSRDVCDNTDELLAAGAFDCLMKPCRMTELERVVDEALEVSMETQSTIPALRHEVVT